MISLTVPGVSGLSAVVREWSCLGIVVQAGPVALATVAVLVSVGLFWLPRIRWTIRKTLLASAICVLMSILIFFLAVYVNRWAVLSTDAENARLVMHILQKYILTSGGDFPHQESDLQDAGIVRVENTAEGAVYWWRESMDNGSPQWYRFRDFQLFRIHYGAEPDDLERVGRSLYSKRSGEKVLLVEGPNKEKLLDAYESISLSLYKSILRVRTETPDRSDDKDFK